MRNDKKNTKQGWRTRTYMAAWTAALILGVGNATAHEGFITTYNHHMMPGEFEIMVMTDYTAPSDSKRANDGHGEYFSHMLEIEYVPSGRLAFEFMIEGFEDTETGEREFTGFRWETRYRLFANEVFLNPTLYAEYEDLHVATRYKMEVSGWVEPPYDEDGEEPSREKILETRLLLSQDVGSDNVAFNWINESDLQTGETAFGYSLGYLHRLHRDVAAEHGRHVGSDGDGNAGQSFIRPASLAFELFGALGDTRQFGLDPSRQEHYFQPSMTFDVAENSMLTFGFGIGLTDPSDDLVRINWGMMF